MSRLKKRGDELFVVVPNDAIIQLGWHQGDVLKVEVAGSALNVTRAMTAHDRAMAIARRGMKKYSATLAALAKS